MARDNTKKQSCGMYVCGFCVVVVFNKLSKARENIKIIMRGLITFSLCVCVSNCAYFNSIINRSYENPE